MIVFATAAADTAPRCGFVLDAAVPVAWHLHRRATGYTDWVLRQLVRGPAAVPASWPIDLADLLRAAERQSQTTPAQADEFLAGLNDFQIIMDAESPLRWWPGVLALSRTRRMPVGKAAYLELAHRLALPLATEDPALARHAAAAGVPIFSP